MSILNDLNNKQVLAMTCAYQVWYIRFSGKHIYTHRQHQTYVCQFYLFSVSNRPLLHKNHQPMYGHRTPCSSIKSSQTQWAVFKVRAGDPEVRWPNTQLVKLSGWARFSEISTCLLNDGQLSMFDWLMASFSAFCQLKNTRAYNWVKHALYIVL